MDRIDKTAFSVALVEDDLDDRAYWHSLTAVERLRIVEQLRRINYGDDATRPMQKIIEIADLE
ncbi:MAG: hypothetical protein AB7G76_04125 [Steroidobacteraceae bacterium]